MTGTEQSTRTGTWRTGLVASWVLLAATMAGCASAAAADPAPLVIVVSPDGHEPEPVLAASELALVRTAAEAGGVAHLLVDDRLANTVDLAPRRPNGQVEHGPRRQTLITGRLAALQAELHRAAGAAPGGDLLAGLVAASRLGPGATILVLDSGLTTLAPADRRILGWELDPAEFARDLGRRGFLADLHGRSVVFAGIGRTAAGQPRLPLPQQRYLRDTWLAVCREAGGTCWVSEEPRPERAPLSRRLPPVVAVPEVLTTAGSDGSVTVQVPSDLLFRAGRCELVDRAAAADAVEGVVARARGGGWTVAISGRTANWGDLAGQLALSRCRARAARDLLVAGGVPAAAIVRVEGVGSTADPPGASFDAAGRFDETRARRLRRVVLTLTPTSSTREEP